MDDTTKVKTNAYTANRVMKVIDWRALAKKWNHLRHHSQNWTEISCGYFDWNRLRRVTLCIGRN